MGMLCGGKPPKIRGINYVLPQDTNPRQWSSLLHQSSQKKKQKTAAEAPDDPSEYISYIRDQAGKRLISFVSNNTLPAE